ncbi:MAG: hypothetical protein AB7O24_31340 [Kofleriaceae bacterium]
MRAKTLERTTLAAVIGGKAASGPPTATNSTTKKVSPKITENKDDKNPVQKFIELGNQFVGEASKLAAKPKVGPALISPIWPAIAGNAKAMSGDGEA